MSDSFPIQPQTSSDRHPSVIVPNREEMIRQHRSIEVLDTGLQRRVYLGMRTDGKPGIGTLNDPYNVSDPDRFEFVMRFKVREYSDVILLPGFYQTRGFCYDTSGGWRLPEGCSMRGAGIGRTTIQLVGCEASGRYVVIKSGYSFLSDDNFWNPKYTSTGLSNGLGEGFITYPWCAVSDLTIDCNWQNQPVQTITTAAVELVGSYTRISRVRVINTGSKYMAGGFGVELFILTCGGPMFSISAGGLGSVNHVIEDCIVEQFQYNGTDGGNTTCIGILGGNAEVNGTEPITTRISGNYIDGTFSNGYVPHGNVGLDTQRLVIQGIGMGVCSQNVIENNTFLNGSYGPYADTHRGKECIIRGNTYRNAWAGVMTNFNGVSWPGGAKWGVDRLTIYDNDIQLMLNTDGVVGGISLIDFSDSAISTPADYQFKTVRIYGNRISLIDDEFSGTYNAGTGIAVTHAESAVIEDNLIRLPRVSTYGHPDIRASIVTSKVGTLKARGNRRPEDNSIIVPRSQSLGRYQNDAEYEDEKMMLLAL